MEQPATDSGNLLRQMPMIRRARDFRLYTIRGRRLVDLWQLGGAALLGHNPPKVLRDFKNTAERGLFAPFPHPMEGRFFKALARLFPGGDFRVYADEFSLRRALDRSGGDAGTLGTAPDGCPWTDPAFSPDPTALPAGARSSALALWRPFLKTGEEGLAFSPDIPVQRPVLPLPWPGSPQVLILEKDRSPGFPPSDPVSPAILAAAIRGIYDLLAAPERGSPRFPKIEKALKKGSWRRRGIYLTLPEAPDAASYAELFRDFLDRGFLLPPSPAQPLILPGILSPGEEAALAELL
ncbi:MAG: hypothetical protein LBC60_00770 [Spirochaetaceae bacterium]|jgi:hypothetical protein|nr:hypothetical protein [Spirochaetaceae bacterium]